MKIPDKKLIDGKELIIPFLSQMRDSKNKHFMFLDEKFVTLPPTYRVSPAGKRVYKDEWITKNFYELALHLEFEEKLLITEDRYFRKGLKKKFLPHSSWEDFRLVTGMPMPPTIPQK